MVHRVIALFLALLLCWSGFATQEQAVALASASSDQVEVGLADQAPQPTEEDHLGDRPGHAQVEGALDFPALVMTLPSAAVPFLTMARPGPYARAAWLAPHLDGPQRPPCATRILA